MPSSDNRIQIVYVSKGLYSVLLFAADMVMFSILMVVNAISLKKCRGIALERMLNCLQIELVLFDLQVERMRPVLEAQHEKQRALFSDASVCGDRQAVREHITAIRDETDNQLESILTPRQFERFRELRCQMMPCHRMSRDQR